MAPLIIKIDENNQDYNENIINKIIDHYNSNQDFTLTPTQGLDSITTVVKFLKYCKDNEEAKIIKLLSPSNHLADQWIECLDRYTLTYAKFYGSLEDKQKGYTKIVEKSVDILITTFETHLKYCNMLDIDTSIVIIDQVASSEDISKDALEHTLDCIREMKVPMKIFIGN